MKVYLNFEDHGSLYDIDKSIAEDLQVMYDIDDMAAHIVECGEQLVYGRPVPSYADMKDCRVFLDVTIPTVDNMSEFLDNVATELVNE